MDIATIQLASFVDPSNPDMVLDEVLWLMAEISPEFRSDTFRAVFSDVDRLFNGRYPGYRACNTEYHDLRHTLDNLMALARLLHGAHQTGIPFSADLLQLGLMSALFHDTGYIQTEDDTTGTGAKYTATHVERSIQFARQYAGGHGFTPDDAAALKTLILCTEGSLKIEQISFPSQEIKRVGQMLGTADLIGQMADRTYLEKLLLLYVEFREGGIQGYEIERDMLVKTTHFYDFVKKRLDKDLGNVNRFMIYHFRKRWNLEVDLYQLTVERNIDYLKKIISFDDYRSHLRRGGIVHEISQKEKQPGFRP